MKKHVIITGPESTGKSTLSEQLSLHFDALLVPEYARGFLEAAGRKALQSDFEHFVEAQKSLIIAAQKVGNKSMIIQDTGAEVLWIWQEDKFDLEPNTIAFFENQQADFYLLCAPDIAWTADDLREDAHRRTLLYKRYQQLLSKQKRPVIEVTGQGIERLNNAILSISNFYL